MPDEIRCIPTDNSGKEEDVGGKAVLRIRILLTGYGSLIKTGKNLFILVNVSFFLKHFIQNLFS